MRFIDIQQEATGFIAIGQAATGVFALGQVAVGFVAVGQVAVGVFTIGQGAVGVMSVGMGGVGVYWTGAMLGIAGRGFGGVIPLAPSLGKPTEMPATVSWGQKGHDTWVDTTLTDGKLEVPDGIRIRAGLRQAIHRSDPCSVVVHLVDGEAGLEVDRIIRIPTPRYRQARWWGIWAVQMTLFVGLCAAYVGGFLIPWLRYLWSA